MDFTKAKDEETGLWVLYPKCSCCGKEDEYKCDATESKTLDKYICYGRQMGYLQDLFPKIPQWIRLGCIDQFSNGFCICPDCSPIETEKENYNEVIGRRE